MAWCAAIDRQLHTTPSDMPPNPRDGREKKHSMAELKLRRLDELNARLTEDLERPRSLVSEAGGGLISYCKTTKDFMLPSVWGSIDRRDDP